MKSELSKKMVDKKAAVNSVLINREFETPDRYPQRVLVFLAAICPITLAITSALPFIPKTNRPILIAITILYVVLWIVEVAVSYFLFASDEIRKRFPVNLLLTMLHSACITVIAEPSYFAKDYRWVLGAMAIAVVLFIICISIGAASKSKLNVDNPAMVIGYIVFSVIIGIVTLAVYFTTKNSTWTRMILAGGMTIVIIPVALYVGQSTLGPPEFREYDTDYCSAAVVIHATLVIFLVMLSLGVIQIPKEREIMLAGLTEPISWFSV
ncbi:unnamed protein product [Trichobilharzia szidati]|nr:unnamed protein product [Trichobilharzia szidati]CAH8846027.1 unnamed protein product [Trichobilharzia szidati]